jgi:hypothetical protein
MIRDRQEAAPLRPWPTAIESILRRHFLSAACAPMLSSPAQPLRLQHHQMEIQMFSRTLVTSALLAGVAFATPAFAGECPAGQMRADATKPSTAAAQGVTDKVLAQIDLADEWWRSRAT